MARRITGHSNVQNECSKVFE